MKHLPVGLFSLLVIATNVGCSGKPYENTRRHGVALVGDKICVVDVNVRGNQWEQPGPCPQTRYSPQSYVAFSVQYNIDKVVDDAVLPPELATLEYAASCEEEPPYGYITEVLPANAIPEISRSGSHKSVETLSPEEATAAAASGFETTGLIVRTNFRGETLLLALPDSRPESPRYPQVLNVTSTRLYTAGQAHVSPCIWDAANSRVFWFSGHSANEISAYPTQLRIWYYDADRVVNVGLQPPTDSELRQFFAASQA